MVKAWEVEAAQIVEAGNEALLPFVGLMRRADEGLMRRGAERLRTLEGGEELEAILALFASFILDAATIQKLVRWNMKVLRESPWYQEIWQEGVEQGLEQGVKQGVKQGQRDLILSLLRARFQVSEGLVRELTLIKTAEGLERLALIAAQAETLDAFVTALTQEIAQSR